MYTYNIPVKLMANIINGEEQMVKINRHTNSTR